MGADSRERVVFSRSARRASRRRKRRALAGKGGALGSDAKATCFVPDKGEGNAWMSDKDEVSVGTNLPKLVRYEGVRRASVCMGRLLNNNGGRTSASTGERQYDEKAVSEREAVEEKSLDINWRGDAVSWGSEPNHTKESMPTFMRTGLAGLLRIRLTRRSSLRFLWHDLVGPRLAFLCYFA